MLLFDLFLVLLLAVGIPAAWSVDTDAIVDGAGQLMRGVKVGNVTISLGNVGMAIVAFVVCMVLARLVRSIVRDRVLPTVDAPMPLRQSIDAGLNYIGVLLALVIGIGALGVDFTNLAIVLGALSVGIGLGLQNIANNVISGVILLVERPIKAGDWVSVAGHEGFVRRINIRATEMETFQRTHVIMPNSMFLQNPVVNRTYSDTSSRVEIKLTVGLATDVAAMEALLREAALGHPRVLRVPPPIVRFERITPSRPRLRAVRVRQPPGRPAGRHQRPQPGDPGQADRGRDRRSQADSDVQAARPRDAARTRAAALGKGRRCRRGAVGTRRRAGAGRSPCCSPRACWPAWRCGPIRPACRRRC